MEEQTVLRWALSVDERAVGRGSNGGDVAVACSHVEFCGEGCIDGERGGWGGVPGDEGALVVEERFCYGWGR